MAQENVDRGLFSHFGKNKEEETHQQYDLPGEGRVSGADPYQQGQVGEGYPQAVSHGHADGNEPPHPVYGHIGEAQPSPVSHGHGGQGYSAPVSQSHGQGGQGYSAPVSQSYGHVGEDYSATQTQGHVSEGYSAPVYQGHVNEGYSAPVGKFYGEAEDKKQVNRSNGSSSSSSGEEEDDEKGVRVKKQGGMREKFRGQKKAGDEYGQEGQGQGPVPVPEKKGMIGKIKEKLPGHNKQEVNDY